MTQAHPGDVGLMYVTNCPIPAQGHLTVQNQEAAVDFVPVHLPQELTPVESARAFNQTMEMVHLHA